MIFGNKESFEQVTFRDYLAAPARFAVAFIQFLIFNWSSSRNGMAFVRAIPALLGVTVVVIPATVALYLVENKQVSFYRDRVAFYHDTMQEPESAEVCARKLVACEPKNRENYWSLGLTLASQNRKQEALELMKYAAQFEPEDSFRAHLWLANDDFSKMRENPADEAVQRDSAKKHLLFVAENADASTRLQGLDASVRLAMVYMDEQAYAPAEQLLNNVLTEEFQSVGQVKAAVMLAQLYKTTDQTERLKLYVDRNVDKLTQLALKFPEYLEIWESAVAMCLLIEDDGGAEGYRRALAVVDQGVGLAPTTDLKRRIGMLGTRVRVREAELVQKRNLFNDPKKDFSCQMGLLALAIRMSPSDPTAYNAVLNLVFPQEPNNQINLWLRESLVSSADLMQLKDKNLQTEYLFVINTVIGFRDAMNDRLDAGKSRWLQAEQQAAQTPLVINNLIQVAYLKWPEQDQKFLALLDAAQEQFPDFPYFQKSMAQIHLANEDFSAARTKYENYVKLFPDDIDAQKQLLTVYEKQNLKGAVESQKAIVDQLDLKVRERQQQTLKRTN